ncbi:glycoside hydrolase family 3 domain-containing protein, partial [Cryptococcus deuterogattii 2001/935-1]
MSENFDIESIVDQLTLEEACALTHGQDFWRLNGVPRLGVPAGEDFVGGCTSALFPAGCSLGASFDVKSAIKVGEALARECRSKSAVALLGPTVNIHRHPTGGRNFESYSEDPYLSGVMASGYIQGLQGAGIASVTKHFVCNDSETDRRTVDVIVGEQALREIYLRPFQIAFERAGPRGIMTSYNKASCPMMRLLESVVRGEWGVEDLTVMSDWWGTYSVDRAIMAGLDCEYHVTYSLSGAEARGAVEMPDSFHRGNGKLLAAAQDDENLAKAVFDRARNVLRMIKRAGGYSLEPERPEVAEDIPETRQLIREVGAEGMTLLKNTGVLPLSPKTKTVVAGTYATVALAHGGGSASLDAHRKITPADGLRDAMDEIVVVPGPVPYLYLPLPQSDVFSSSEGAGTCKVDFYNPDGSLVESRTLNTTFLTALDRYPKNLVAGWTAKMSFKLLPKTTGTHALTVASPSSAKLSINGHTYTFEGGKVYDVVIDYVSTEELFYSTACALNGIRFGYLEYADDDAAIQSAVKVAEEVGTVVVCVGHGSDYETEGFDRDDMLLLGKQNAFVQALAES